MDHSRKSRLRCSGWRWPSIVLAMLLAGTALVYPQRVHAATFTVTKTADTNDGVCNADCSLREAIVAANASAGADTITFNVNGSFLISVSPGSDENASASGDFDLTSDITIQGNGAGNTIIDGGGVDRVFDVAPLGGPPITVVFSGLTIQNGKAYAANFNVGGGMFINNNATVTISNSTLANNLSMSNSGGAIENRGTLTLATVAMQNNTAFALGGAINNIGALTVNDSTFTLNEAERGGALYINTDNGKTATITGSRFSSNQAVATAGGAGDDGGAIAIDSDGAANISGSTFTGNVAAGNGGAVYFNDSATQAAAGTLAMSYNRIAGNTAAAGNGLFGASGAPAAERNWWGCNSGPASAPCDVVSGTGDFTPWIGLSHTASPSTINTGQAATLTADFLKNSDGSANAAGNLGALTGVPVSFGNAVLGTISAAQSTIQANGAATATFTAGAAPGAGSAGATVDGATATATITIIQADTVAPDVAMSSAAPDPTNTSPIPVTVQFSENVAGFAAGDIVTGNGTVINFAGGGSIFTFDLVPSGQGLVTADIAAGVAQDGAGNPNTAAAQFSRTYDSVAPTVTIEQATGQADPTSGSPIHFTAVFAEPVTGFADGDVTLSGTAGATTAAVTGGPATYDVAVSGMTTAGTVIATISAGAAVDAAGNGNTASTSTDNTVTFTTNRAPTAVADSYSTNEDTPLTIAAPGVLANDTDPDPGDTLTAVMTSSPNHGSVTLNSDGSFQYTPAANYNGSDSFTYKAQDSQGAESAPVAVTITVNAVDDPPTVTVAGGGSCSATSVSGTMNLAVGDVDSPIGNVTLTGSSSDPQLVPAANITFGGSGADRTVTITAVPQKSGKIAVVTVTAGDGSGATSAVAIKVIVGTDKKETINGTPGADMIFGLNGNDTIKAGDGNDLACGGNGSGVLQGGKGADTLDGGRGDDKLRGEAGNDILRGGQGDDTLTGNAGADFFSGGPGTDRATDFTPADGDTQDGTLDLFSSSAVEQTEQLYLPIVAP